jgi:hypothetical protein
MSTMTPEVAEAIRLLDKQSASWSEEDQAAWRKVRGFVRARHKESQRSLPAISLAAQEMVQVRDHAHAALDAMASVFGRRDDDDDTAKHGKLPPAPEEPTDE